MLRRIYKRWYTPWWARRMSNRSHWTLEEKFRRAAPIICDKAFAVLCLSPLASSFPRADGKIMFHPPGREGLEHFQLFCFASMASPAHRKAAMSLYAVAEWLFQDLLDRDTGHQLMAMANKWRWRRWCHPFFRMWFSYESGLGVRGSMGREIKYWRSRRSAKGILKAVIRGATNGKLISDAFDPLADIPS